MNLSRWIARAGFLLPAVLAAACSDVEARSAEGRGAAAVRLDLEPVVRLRDDSASVLARPEWLSVTPDGRFLATDLSDKNVKVYGPSGQRLHTVGRAGGGPGEFAALMTAQAYRDSLLAYDLAGSRLSVFGPDGRYARALSLNARTRPKTFLVRVADDSLFVLAAAVPGSGGRPLVSLVRPDGSAVASFFDAAGYLRGDLKLQQQTAVLADAADGVAFAALVGGDSVYAFDYAGRRLGAGAIDPVQPLVTTRTLLARSGGRERRPDGSYFSHGNRNVIGLVALDSATVAMQVSPYDAVHGTDPLDGGTLIIATLRREGRIEAIGREEVQGALLGRDREGRPLMLRYTTPQADEYEVVRVRLASAEPGR